MPSTVKSAFLKIIPLSARYCFIIILFAVFFYFIFIHNRLYGEFDLSLNFGTIIHQNFAEHHTLHFWAHTVSGGFPLYASPEAPLLDFANLLYIIIPNPVTALDLSLLAYLVIAGIGMFLLAYEFERSRGVALLAAVIYMFTGNMLYALQLMPYFYPSAMVPLVFFFVLKAMRKEHLKDVVLFALLAAFAWSFQILSGGSIIFLWTSLGIAFFLTFFFLVNIIKKFKGKVVIKFAALGVALVLFVFLFSAVKVLPSLEIKDISQRAGQLSWENFIWKDTQIKAKDMAGSMLFSVGSRAYLGPIALLLVFASILRLKRPHVLFFWLLALAVVLVEVGSPLTKVAYAVPVLNATRQIYNSLVLFSLSATVLAAGGAVALIKLFRLSFRKQMAFSGLLSILTFALVIFSFGKIHSSTPVEAYHDELRQNSLLQYVASDSDIFRIHYPTADTPTNFIGTSISRYTVPLRLQLSEWTSGNLWFLSYVTFNEMAGISLSQSAKWWGIVNVKYIASPAMIDRGRVPGFTLLRIFSPCALCDKKLVYLYRNERYLPRAYFVNSSVLVVDSDIMWVTYDLMLQDYFDPSQAVLEIDNKKLKGITSDELAKYASIIMVDVDLPPEAESILKLYSEQNKSVLRYVLTQDWLAFKIKDGGNLKTFYDKQGPLTKNLSFLFSELPKNDVSPVPVVLTPTKVSVKIENASHPRFLVISDRFYQFKDWEAVFNGKRLEIKGGNVVASVIEIPQGETGTLVLVYKPKKFYLGLLMTASAVLLLILYIVYVRKTKKDSTVNSEQCGGL